MTCKTKTCEDCEFNVDGQCRRFPPVFSTLYDSYYPYVGENIEDYLPACAEYKEKEKE